MRMVAVMGRRLDRNTTRNATPAMPTVGARIDHLRNAKIPPPSDPPYAHTLFIGPPSVVSAHMGMLARNAFVATWRAASRLKGRIAILGVPHRN